MEIKIKAKSSLIKNIKLSVPYDGTIEVDENGVAVVSEACANVLVNNTHDWDYADRVETAAKDEVDGSDINSLLDKIKSAPLDELVSIATEAGYDKKEWSKFAKNTKAAQKLMSGYLIKKFNEVSEEVEDVDSNSVETAAKDEVEPTDEVNSEDKSEEVEQ